MKVKIHTAYDTPHDEGVKFLDEFGEPQKSLTVQSEKDECDVNILMERYAKTGVITMNQAQPRFMDVTDAPTFQEALHIVQQANDAFASLDAKIRREFDNDPVKFLEFIGDEKNHDRALELGLIEAKQAQPKQVDAPAATE